VHVSDIIDKQRQSVTFLGNTLAILATIHKIEGKDFEGKVAWPPILKKKVPALTV
jgi:hypothetical protein